MGADERGAAVRLKQHINDFEQVDKLTFYFCIGAFVVWAMNYPFSSGLYDMILRTVVPVILAAFAASRRWSGLLNVGPAAVVED